MSFKEKLSKWANCARPVLWGLLACLVVNFVALAFFRMHQFKRQATIQPWTGVALDANHETDEELERYNASLVLDSILSIVQSYYVDADRVENAKLLQRTLGSLALNPEVKLSGTSKGSQTLISHGQNLAVITPETLDYQELLATFVTLSRFLETTYANDAPSKLDKTNWEHKGNVLLLNAMLHSLDAHSSLLSPLAYEELRQGTEGSFGGLGVLVGLRDQLLTVIKPLPESPAVRAGIKKLDRILSINGKPTYGFSLDDLVEYMRGAPGSSVDLSVMRAGDLAPKTITMKREVIKVDSVVAREYNEAGKNYLYVRIESFSSRTALEVRSALRRFRKKNHDLHGVILDLRSNPGGLLEQAVLVSDIFLKSGVIVTTKGRRSEVEKANSEQAEMDYPLVLLINSDSASASEIVAGALQDHRRAVVIGQPSFGKGSVQTIFELPGDQALKLTIARYYTPSGRSIQNVGIMPDIWLQPLYDLPTNSNLLGNYRYKNERFLLNHLEVAQQKSAGNGLAIASDDVATFKGYYLAQVPEEDDDFEHPERDEEFKMAMTMLHKIAGVYGATLPEGAKRSSHWLALASLETKAQLDQLNAAAQEWLRAKFEVNWDVSKKDLIKYDDVDISANIKESQPLEVVQGDAFEIEWKIDNKNRSDLEQVSMYVNSSVQNIETNEQLVGHVAGSGIMRGKFKLRIPAFIEPGLLTYNLGLSAGGVPKMLSKETIPVLVVARQVAKINALVSLIDEKGGTKPGVLEPLEQAMLKIDLTNAGTIDAHDVAVQIANLAGAQVVIDNKRKSIGTIKSHGSQSIYLPIRGAAKMVDAGITCGLAVESRDFVESIRQEIKFQASPNTAKLEVIGALSH